MREELDLYPGLQVTRVPRRRDEVVVTLGIERQSIDDTWQVVVVEESHAPYTVGRRIILSGSYLRDERIWKPTEDNRKHEQLGVGALIKNKGA